MDKYVGESEKNVKSLFQEARKKAEAEKLAVIFIDEVDSLCGTRSASEHDCMKRVKSELLIQMEGISDKNEGVVVLGATNMPWALDDAFKRRFQKQIYIYIPLPEKPARKMMFEIYIRKCFCDIQVDVDKLAELTNGYSGADINTVVKDVHLQSIIWATHFKKHTGPSPTDSSIIVDDLWTPCDSQEPGAVKMSLKEVKPDKLVIRCAKFSEFVKGIENNLPTVSREYMKQYEAFLNQSRQS